MKYAGVKVVLDLEACMYFAQAGSNMQISLYERAANTRMAITADTLDKVRLFDSDLADFIEASPIEVHESDDNVYESAANLTSLLVSLTARSLDRAANDKLPVVALSQCAQNGIKPSCIIVSGDEGSHKSSMRSICDALGVMYLSIDDFMTD